MIKDDEKGDGEVNQDPSLLLQIQKVEDEEHRMNYKLERKHTCLQDESEDY